MGLYEDFQAERRRRHDRRRHAERAWPVGKGVVLPGDEAFGHDDSLFVPEEYGDYIATAADVYSAATLRARLISGLRLQLFRGVGPTRKEATSGPAVELLRRVNPFWTAARLARMDELAMCLWGESYWAVERDPLGVPSEIWWMKPSRVKPVPHENNYLGGFLYEPVIGGGLIPFKPDEVIWFRYPNPLDEFSALSPVAAARLAADTGSSMMKANRNIFDNGLQMAAMVVPASDRVTFSSEQADQLSDDLERRFKGVDKRHKWAVLRYEAQIKEVGITQHDAEFVAGLNLTLRKVCNAYGVPSPLLNDMEHATLANLRELLTAVWTLALVPDSKLKAAEIAEQFLPLFPGRRPDEAEYDYTQVPELQEAASEVWARERQAIEVGRKTINEIRLANGEPPVPWGDAWWAPVNKAPVSGPDGFDTSVGDSGNAAESDIPTLITAVGVLIRAGFDPAASLEAVGLDPIKHVGLLPVTLQKPEDGTLPAPADSDVSDAIETAKSDPDAVADDEVPPEAGTGSDMDDTARDLLLAAFNGNKPAINGHARSH